MLISCGLPIKASATLVGTSAGAGPKQSKPKEKPRRGDRLRIIKTAVWTVLGLLVAGVAGFGVLAYQPEIAADFPRAPAHLHKCPGTRVLGFVHTMEPTPGPPRTGSAPRLRHAPSKTPVGR